MSTYRFGLCLLLATKIAIKIVAEIFGGLLLGRAFVFDLTVICITLL